MDHTYRIEGAGDEAAFLEATAMANEAVVDLAGVGGTTNVLFWFTQLLAAAGASAVAILVWRASLGEIGPPDPARTFLAILVGTALYVAVLLLLNRWISRGTARAFLADPMMQNHHVLLSVDGMRVVSGQTYSHFAWPDVTRIEASANVILVMAGMAWAYIPLSGFADPEEAKSALADMRRWQSEARP